MREWNLRECGAHNSEAAWNYITLSMQVCTLLIEKTIDWSEKTWSPGRVCLNVVIHVHIMDFMLSGKFSKLDMWLSLSSVLLGSTRLLALLTNLWERKLGQNQAIFHVLVFVFGGNFWGILWLHGISYPNKKINHIGPKLFLKPLSRFLIWHWNLYQHLLIPLKKENKIIRMKMNYFWMVYPPTQVRDSAK